MGATKRIFVLVVALVLSLWIAGTAAGGPDCEDPKFESHPLCMKDPEQPPKEPVDGVTCLEAVEVYGGTPHVDYAEDGFSAIVTDGHLCVDWKATTAATWEAIITPHGARNVSMTVRDSHPGDWCWRGLAEWRPRDPDEPASLLITHANGPLANGGPLPASTSDVCGEDFTDTYLGLFPGTPPHSADPFVLMIDYKGKNPIHVEIRPVP